MSKKPLNISEEAAVQMPMKTVASLIAMIAVGTWAYFGIHEKLNQHSTKIELMTKDLEQTQSLELNIHVENLVNQVERQSFYVGGTLSRCFRRSR